MKIIKINNKFNNKGMALLEFILAFLLVFVILTTFMKIGFILKQEAIIIATTKNAGRNLQVSGVLTQSEIDSIKNKLASMDINNLQVKITKQNGGTINIGQQIGFRESFVLAMKATYKVGNIEMPLIYFTDGKSEMFIP